MHPPQYCPPHRHPHARSRTAVCWSAAAEQLLCSRHAGWRATRVRGRGRRGRRGSWRGLSLGVAPGCDAHDVQVHMPCAPPRPRTGPRTRGLADAHAGPWTRVAAAGGRAAAHIAAHMMPPRPINPPTGSSRTPLGASSLVASTIGVQTQRRPFADHSWSAEIRSTAAGRLARAAGRRRAELAILLTLRGSGCSCAPPEAPQFCAHRDAPRRRAEDRVRTERDL